MKTIMVALAVAATVLGVAAAPASAWLANGSTAPIFTKPEHLTGTPRSLADYSGKVVVLFQLGYS